MPFGELITGICRRSASAVSSAPASDSVTPWPMKITGRLAAAISSSARSTSSGAAPLRWRQVAGRWRLERGLGRLLEQVERHIELDRARGGPASMVVVAWRRNRGSISTRVGWKLRLTTGRSTFGKSAWIVPVELLERAAVELLGRDVGGDRQKRRGIGERHRERHDQIAGAGPAGGERRGRLVADAEEGIGHMAGDLLVPRRDQARSDRAHRRGRPAGRRCHGRRCQKRRGCAPGSGTR